MATTPPTVLIVEDSPTQARIIASALSLHQIQTVIAGDGREGLRMAMECQPDVIILDINLPELDGYQVCRRLKRDKATAHIPVIMLTLSDSSEATIQGLEVGAADYIAKDVWSNENLLVALHSYITFN